MNSPHPNPMCVSTVWPYSWLILHFFIVSHKHINWFTKILPLYTVVLPSLLCIRPILLTLLLRYKILTYLIWENNNKPYKAVHIVPAGLGTGKAVVIKAYKSSMNKTFLSCFMLHWHTISYILKKSLELKAG